MANVVLNSDFRLTDTSERQILRQAVAQQQAKYNPLALLGKIIAKPFQTVAEVWVATRDTMDLIDQRYPALRDTYI